MDFRLAEHHLIFRQALRRFAEKEISPLVTEAEEKEVFPRQLFPRVGSLGYLGIRYPAQYGGAGVDKIADVIWAEELSRVCTGISRSLGGHSHLGTYPVYKFGTEEQKGNYLVPAIKGEKVSAFALTEPNAGSDAKAIETVARRRGEVYLLNGTKTFISNGTFADYVIVVAYTDKSIGYRGISLFIVDRDSPGFSVIRKLKKEGLRSCEAAELAFEDCQVPARNLIGGREGSFPELMETLSEGRIGVAGAMVGLAQAALEASLSYAGHRVQFGQPIGKFQAISFKLADMATLVEAARLLVYQAAWRVDVSEDFTKEASMCKLFASEVAVKVAREAIQIHGGYGQTRDFPVGRYLRDALVYTVGEGTSEIQRLIISREIGL